MYAQNRTNMLDWMQNIVCTLHIFSLFAGLLSLMARIVQLERIMLRWHASELIPRILWKCNQHYSIFRFEKRKYYTFLGCPCSRHSGTTSPPSTTSTKPILPKSSGVRPRICDGRRILFSERRSGPRGIHTHSSVSSNNPHTVWSAYSMNPHTVRWSLIIQKRSLRC